MTEVEGLPTLLVVDDDEAFRETMGAALGRRGFAVTLASNAVQAGVAAKQVELEYALVDVRMPGPSGIERVERLRAADEGTRIVVLTGFGSIANAVAAMRAGAQDYLTKPTDAAACERALLGRVAEPESDDSLPSLERVEWEYLQRVLSDSGGNVSQAARRLGMHRRSLQRKLGRNAPRR